MKLNLAARPRRPSPLARFIRAQGLGAFVVAVPLVVVAVAVVFSYSSGVRTGHWTSYPEHGARVYELDGRTYRELPDGTLVPRP